MQNGAHVVAHVVAKIALGRIFWENAKKHRSNPTFCNLHLVARTRTISEDQTIAVFLMFVINLLMIIILKFYQNLYFSLSKFCTFELRVFSFLFFSSFWTLASCGSRTTPLFSCFQLDVAPFTRPWTLNYIAKVDMFGKGFCVIVIRRPFSFRGQCCSGQYEKQIHFGLWLEI